MGGNYAKSIYSQLIEVIERLDSVEKSSNKEIGILNDKIENLEKENTVLKHENQLLKDDNKRLKRIIHNDSSNSSLPHPQIPKAKLPIPITAGKKPERRLADSMYIKEQLLQRKRLKKNSVQENLNTPLKKVGTPNGAYATKYVLDLEIVPIIREIRIYADKDGKFRIPWEYRSEVTYGAEIKAIAVDQLFFIFFFFTIAMTIMPTNIAIIPKTIPEIPPKNIRPEVGIINDCVNDSINNTS